MYLSFTAAAAMASPSLFRLERFIPNQNASFLRVWALLASHLTVVASVLRKLPRLQRKFSRGPLTGAAERLSVGHCLYKPRYAQFQEALESARLESWQHCLSPQTSSKLRLVNKFRTSLGSQGVREHRQSEGP